MQRRTGAILIAVASSLTLAQSPVSPKDSSATIIGYVRDSGCVHRFHEVVKPLPNGCVEACDKAGSPLVILTREEQVYHPISAEMPDVDVRGKLLPFLGKLVRIKGHVYSRQGSNAISLEAMEAIREEDAK
jgi:hypothetical protein